MCDIDGVRQLGVLVRMIPEGQSDVLKKARQHITNMEIAVSGNFAQMDTNFTLGGEGG